MEVSTPKVVRRHSVHNIHNIEMGIIICLGFLFVDFNFLKLSLTYFYLTKLSLMKASVTTQSALISLN